MVNPTISGRATALQLGGVTNQSEHFLGEDVSKDYFAILNSKLIYYGSR